MPHTGNQYIVPLKKTHLGWGTHRKTYSRARIGNEGYVPIPLKYAMSFNITNINNKRQSNIYKFSTSDGFFKDQELKASGFSKKGSIYAKNLHGNRNLKLLGAWFTHTQTKIGDLIKVEFVSPTEILLTKI
ncbi:hypothetical protein [Flavobacterium tistrianum]|uniref:hypothetical protein n=1 Tax=Flavobacterium tistrianum TaxID=1685414 RepID=UPI000DAEF052|nr:hypothetical protein [Flavobacterium tistrianum]KAF2339808.1 hypothetical protein DMB71_15185 [Flavobacterium tistrianum]